MRAGDPTFGWLRIVRLGLVQSALGAVVVIAISTLNRVMVVEYALPATLPGALVALHYVVQFVRPRLGHGAEASGNLPRWIVGGMALLAAGGFCAALATSLMGVSFTAGSLLAVAAYLAIGGGVGAAGTSLLVLLARLVPAGRRPGAATVMWIMMIAGFAVTSGVAGRFLDPYSPTRLLVVTALVAVTAFAVATAAVLGIESTATTDPAAPCRQRAASAGAFHKVFVEVWEEHDTRRFAVFVFISMMAYSAQELLLEPYAGVVHHLSPGQSTQLSGTLHTGATLGMVLVAVLGGRWMRGRSLALRTWMILGCVASAILLCWFGLAASLVVTLPLKSSVYALGLANGVFAVAAIGSMMELGAVRQDGRTGIRVGLWGAAQAIAFAIGGLVATLLVDLARQLSGSPIDAYSSVFLGEGMLFAVAAGLAARLDPGSRPALRDRARSTPTTLPSLESR